MNTSFLLLVLVAAAGVVLTVMAGAGAVDQASRANRQRRAKRGTEADDLKPPSAA